MSTRGWEQVTAAEVAAMGRKAVRMPKARSKYGAVKTTVDGIVFDSQAEAAHYQTLKARQAAGEISDLTVQPVIPLLAASVNDDGGEACWVPTFVANYVADFRYREQGRIVWVDVKGFKTALYRLKKKFAEACTGVTITEVR